MPVAKDRRFVLIPLRVGRLFGRPLDERRHMDRLVLIPLRVGRLFGPTGTTPPTGTPLVLIPLRVGRLFGLSAGSRRPRRVRRS